MYYNFTTNVQQLCYNDTIQIDYNFTINKMYYNFIENTIQLYYNSLLQLAVLNTS